MFTQRKQRRAMRRTLQRGLMWLWQRLEQRLHLMQKAVRRTLYFTNALIVGSQLRGLLVILGGVISFGTLGYTLIEGWHPFESFYMTMITITTVGFTEVGVMDRSGRFFTVLLILLAVTLVAYGVSSLVEYIVSGQLIQSVTEKQRRDRLKTMYKHFIIAGYGRVGQEVAAALGQEQVDFVVVEQDPKNVELAREDAWVVVEGSATEDDILVQAGIHQARGIICSTGSDATNVYIVLTARGLNPNLFVIARASDANSEHKLLRAGADRVISPYVLSGRRMASLALRPYVVNFLDVTGRAGELEKNLEEIVVESGSLLENRTIGEADLGNRTGALILAVYRATGELLTNPRTETLLEAGTRMIVLGTRDALDVMQALSRNLASLGLSQQRGEA
jgi:voltage-gated potassium channel